ncbi:amidohydrolase [bacterium AH-315-E10]|nr:amidohydrolase [bacterium AH-315-E10]
MNHTHQDKIRDLISANLSELIDLRHRIHSEPEIHFTEVATRRKLESFIQSPKLKIWEPLLGTDLIADLIVDPDKPTICLRADMDALPICEENDLPYKSKSEGLMHACGHDGHSTILAGTVRILCELSDQLPVNVRFVFQPAEEIVCGGKDLVKKGACDDIDAAFALHGWPGSAEKQIISRPGTLMAAGDFYSIIVTGKGGHAAMPDKYVNPIIPACYISSKIQELHNDIYETYHAVISVSMFNAGDADNIIPEHAEIKGTIRYLEASQGKEIEKRLRSLIDDVKETCSNVQITLDHRETYNLPVINSDISTAYVKSIAEELTPEANYREADAPNMASEDFAFYLKDNDGAMFWLGLGEDCSGLHTATFNFNDNVIETGILMFSNIALQYSDH